MVSIGPPPRTARQLDRPVRIGLGGRRCDRQDQAGGDDGAIDRLEPASIFPLLIRGRVSLSTIRFIEHAQRRAELRFPVRNTRLRQERTKRSAVMRPPLNREDINDTAKLIMHRLIARSLARDPSLVDRARSSLDEFLARFPDRSFVQDWNELLHLPAEQIRVLSHAPESRNETFAVVVSFCDCGRYRLYGPSVAAAD